MKTRLRLAHEQEDSKQPAQGTPGAPQADFAPVQPRHVAHLLHLQRTHGNAFVQRHLGLLTHPGSRPMLIERDTGKPGTGGAAPKPATPAQPAQTPVFYMTGSIDGRPLPGTSKRRGHEGQIEGLSFHPIGRESGNSGTTRKRSRETQGTGDMISFVITKKVDGVSASLAEAAARGKHVVLQFVFVKQDDQGRETVQSTWDLTDALISGYQLTRGGDETAGSLEQVTIEPTGVSITLPDVNP